MMLNFLVDYSVKLEIDVLSLWIVLFFFFTWKYLENETMYDLAQAEHQSVQFCSHSVFQCVQFRIGGVLPCSGVIH